MSKFIKIIISLILVLSMCIPFSGVVFADSYTSSITSFWDQYVYNQQKSADQGATVDGLAAYVISSGVQGIYHNDSVCQNTDSGLHESTNTTSLGSGTDDYGAYYILQCDYCNSSFRCYSSDLASAYEFIDRPFDTVNNEGGLIWYPEFAYICAEIYFQNIKYRYYSPGSGFEDSESLSGFLYGFNDNLTSVSIFEDYSGISHYAYFHWIDVIPITGSYVCVNPTFNKQCFSDGVVYNSTYPTYGYLYVNGSAKSACTLPDSMSITFSSLQEIDLYYYLQPGWSYVDDSTFSFSSSPYFIITPLTADTTTTNYYVNASRPTYNITYNLATVNNYGDYTVINNVYENQTIINEGDNIYTDIKTGNEYEIEGWEFDYTSRRYRLTLDNGDLVDVTFGDEYVTVEVNGEVEYYYYVTEDDSAAGCTHEYDLAESVAATCEEDGYNVYVCTLCNHSYKDQIFAIGHNYQFLWTVFDTYEVDTSTLVCPGCNGTDITCTQVDNTENFTCVCNSTDCAQTWTVVGSTIAGYDLYQCMNCQEFYNDYTHEGVDRSDAGYWSWLQTWLQNFKTWLGEKLDALINKEVAVGGDTIKNEEVNNFYDQSDTTINTDESIDYNITYTDSDGTEQETSLKGIIAKFAFIKDIWKIGQTLISVVSEDAAYAYEFDPAIGNEASTDSGEEVAAVSAEDQAIVLASDGSSGAPSIPLNLGAANSVYGWNYGGEVEMLELDWYTPYKETVDKLTGGFLWLFFMWKLFMKAPGILSGASMDSSKAEDVKSGTKGKRR